MAALKGQCSPACHTDKRSCWHSESKILKRFRTGKFLIENRLGYVRGASPGELKFNDDEAHTYKDYDLEATEEDLEAEFDRQVLRAKYQNSRSTNRKM